MTKKPSIFHGLQLTRPGDSMTMRITPSGRKVATVCLNNGAYKYSATEYPNGTIVETQSTKNI